MALTQPFKNEHPYCHGKNFLASGEPATCKIIKVKMVIPGAARPNVPGLNHLLPGTNR